MLKDEAKKALVEALNTIRNMGVSVTTSMTDEKHIHLLILISGGEAGLQQVTSIDINATDANSIEKAFMTIHAMIVTLRNYRRDRKEAADLFQALRG